MFSRLFCKHNWEVTVDKVFPSKFDRVKMVTKTFKARVLPDDFFDQTHLCIMVCTKCGKVVRSVTTI